MPTARARRYQKVKGRLETRGFESTAHRRSHEEWAYTLRGHGVAHNGLTLVELEYFVDDWDQSQKQQGPLSGVTMRKSAKAKAINTTQEKGE